MNDKKSYTYALVYCSFWVLSLSCSSERVAPVVTNIYIVQDLFAEFSKPKVPEEVVEFRASRKQFNGLSAYIETWVRTDTNGRVRSIKLFDRRDLSMSEEGEIPDSLWDALKESITEASEKWVVSPDAECLKIYSHVPTCKSRTVLLLFHFDLIDIESATEISTMYVRIP